MAPRKRKSRKAAKGTKAKTASIQKKIRKIDATLDSKSGAVADDTPRRSARVAAKSAGVKNPKRERSRFFKVLGSEQELPMTLATMIRAYRIENNEDQKRFFNLLPGYSKEETEALLKKWQALPQRQRQKAYDKAREAGIDKVLVDTFGFRYPSRKNTSSDVWFWDQALGSWRLWVISGTGHVHETFHLRPPPKVHASWKTEVKERGRPGLDLRTQPAFHLAEDGSVKMVNMPLTIITDRETFISTEPLKTNDVPDEANSKHFNIPLDRIRDPCLIIEISEAIPRLRVGLKLYDPFTPLGFPFDPKELIDEWDDGDLDGVDHLLWGRACWDWVFSDFVFNIDPFEHRNHYFFRQDGDTYTLSVQKPHGLDEEESAAWHADIPYGPFAAFARAVNATFWPPAPRPGLGSYGAVRSPASPYQSPTSPAFTYPESPFPLASVPITRYKSGKPWDPNRLSNHAAHFGVSTPALGDIATHLRVALPAQPSPLPAIRSRTSPRSNRMTASAMNSPHDSPKH